MFIRILIGGIVASMFAMAITLSIVNTSKTKDLDARLVKVTKELKEQDAEIKKIKEEFASLEKKGQGGGHGDVHWAYEGEMGPENWGKHFATCGTGKSQSPVNITAPFEKATVAIKPEYKPGVLTVLNNGHTSRSTCPRAAP